MSSTTLNYAVYVSGACMARFVHAPDAAHFRQQLIHRIREESPDLDPVLVAAGVTVEDAPHESHRHQADGLPVHVWLCLGRSVPGQRSRFPHGCRSGKASATAGAPR